MWGCVWVLVLFFVYVYPLFLALFVEKTIFSTEFSFCLIENQFRLYVGLFLSSPFCSVNLYFCPYASTTLSKFCSFSKLFWPPKILCFSTDILGSTCQFIPKSMLGFWLRFCGIYNQFGEYWQFNNIETSDIWTQLFRSLISLITVLYVFFCVQILHNLLLNLPLSSSYFSAIINYFLISISNGHWYLDLIIILLTLLCSLIF